MLTITTSSTMLVLNTTIAIATSSLLLPAFGTTPANPAQCCPNVTKNLHLSFLLPPGLDVSCWPL
jgi:hypothetical protein